MTDHMSIKHSFHFTTWWNSCVIEIISVIFHIQWYSEEYNVTYHSNWKFQLVLMYVRNQKANVNGNKIIKVSAAYYTNYMC